MPGRTCISRSVVPALLALGLVLPVACGARTPLDQPVDLTGGAGTKGRAGTTGHAGTTGIAGTSGTAGTMGIADASGIGGTGGVAQCTDGMSRCASTTLIQLCQGGQWAGATSCSMMCLSGVCTECVPGAQECAGPASLRTCTSHGLWPEPVMCPGATPICAKGACSNVDSGIPEGTCMEGTTECQDAMTVRLCQGGTWSIFFSCEHGCIGNGICAECKPGDIRCNGSQKCTDIGVWEGTPCPNG